MHFKRRPAEMKDLEEIYRWRSDAAAREASLNPSEFSLKEHTGWFRKALEDKDRVMYVYEEDNGKIIGMVRFDMSGTFSAEVSINLAPEMRGKGYGQEVLSDSVTGFFKEKDVKLIIARIKADNPVSLKTFKNAGFNDLFCYRINGQDPAISVLGRLK